MEKEVFSAFINSIENDLDAGEYDFDHDLLPDYSMSKDQAIEAMNAGAKVRHRFFENDEWIEMEVPCGAILDEKGYVLYDFWKYRYQQHWQEGWDLKR